MAKVLQTLSGRAHRRGELLAGITHAHDETARRLSGQALVHAVDALRVAIAERPDHLHGASAAGHRLAGAVAYSEPDIRIWRPGVEAPVLLLDGVIADTSGVEWTAATCRRLGAVSVEAIVLGLRSDSGLSPRPDSALAAISVLESDRSALAA